MSNPTIGERIMIAPDEERWRQDYFDVVDPVGLRVATCVSQGDAFAIVQAMNAAALATEALAEKDAEIGRLRERLKLEAQINWRQTHRWLSAIEQYNKAKDNAEATEVFRKFVKEPWLAEHGSESLAEHVAELQAEVVRLQSIIDGTPKEVERLREAAEAAAKVKCPRDTNGDGDCGQRLCPVCGRGGIKQQLQAALAAKATEAQP